MMTPYCLQQQARELGEKIDAAMRAAGWSSRVPPSDKILVPRLEMCSPLNLRWLAIIFRMSIRLSISDSWE
jgi:hypothetical protein